MDEVCNDGPQNLYGDRDSPDCVRKSFSTVKDNGEGCNYNCEADIEDNCKCESNFPEADWMVIANLQFGFNYFTVWAMNY